MAELKLTRADDGKVFEVRQGDAIIIEIGEPGGTLFTWQVETIDDQLVALQTSEIVQDRRFFSQIGGTIMRRLRFETKRAGTARIELKLDVNRMPLEPFASQGLERNVSVPEQRYAVTINIQN